jgi:hypothetical protein
MTISTGPVVVNKMNTKVLLHLSASTGKYQFIGGRLDDSLSFRENALYRAREVVGENLVIITHDTPTILLDTIDRDGEIETILLVHYKASIENETITWNARWFTIEEIETLHKDNQLSSPNILICSTEFLKK